MLRPLHLQNASLVLAGRLASVLQALATRGIPWGAGLGEQSPSRRAGKAQSAGRPGEEAGEDGHADAGRRVPVAPIVVVVLPVVVPSLLSVMELTVTLPSTCVETMAWRTTRRFSTNAAP